MSCPWISLSAIAQLASLSLLGADPTRLSALSTRLTPIMSPGNGGGVGQGWRCSKAGKCEVKVGKYDVSRDAQPSLQFTPLDLVLAIYYLVLFGILCYQKIFL